MRRNPDGVMLIEAEDDDGLAAGLGWAHARDRLLQMMLLRLVAQGRVSQCLRSTPDALRIDTFMRQMGFARAASVEAERCSTQALRFALAYCDGVNTYLRTSGLPLGLRLLGVPNEPWRVADILLTLKVMSYMGLAQTQCDVEKLIVQALVGGVDRTKLQALFAPHLDGVDDTLVELLGRVTLVEGLLPEAVRFAPELPRFTASNNWAVAAHRSASGRALQCNDPHLDVNRLPAIWYEWVGRTPNEVRAGISMPGVPGLVMGRTGHLSYGFTYGFMDTVDYFVEEVREGAVRRDGDWSRVHTRTEVIQRKRKRPVELEVRETSHGVLESDGAEPLRDGFYLCRAWSGHRAGGARSLDAIVEVMRATGVEEAARAVRRVAISANWLFADTHGRIAFQQSGLLPDRVHGGLHPVPGWRQDLAWRGFVDPERLSSEFDPPSGLLVTANDDVDRPGRASAITLSMGSYRADRIRELLERSDRLDREAMKRIQRDLVSLQAERLLAQWTPWLPDNAAGRTLQRWDRNYDVHSLGAPLFERAYAEVLAEVFGRGLFGSDAWARIQASTSITADYHATFDRVLLGDDPLWWGSAGKRAVIEPVLHRALREGPAHTWGEVHRITMRHLVFGGTAPAFAGLDYGPLPLPGGRATVCQGSLFEAHGRASTFAPSWRYVADMGADHIETVLAGGVSANRRSAFYLSDVERWRHFTYKRLSLET